jgi:hypothetical protein
MHGEQRRIVAEDGGMRECAANSICGGEPNRGNALAQLMVAMDEFIVDGAPLKDD